MTQQDSNEKTPKKSVLASMDENLIAELITVAQFALNDPDAIERVKALTGYSVERIEVIAGMLIGLFVTDQIDLPYNAFPRTTLELESKIAELAERKAKFVTH
ncbi:hypothetical protein [Vreelandella titanicae]|uniref:hypothetical protein n=1 Tax=Vreelandella titanicae TaxID=664683 RepID=UPI001F3CAAC0|nr:hypothetical protein [Halomonas titanicae]MCE7521291.1 hypothetical protein [Halomonas titanicae]